MRSKKSKEPKKYVTGGFIAAGALGGLQGLIGAGQYIAGQSAASRIKEASTASPSEYAEMLKLARGAELETKRLEELNRSIATGINAAQSAGGRAQIGALPGMIRASDTGALQILGERQDRTMQALGISAQGSEREIGREINREMMERGAAQAAIEGGLQNFAGGLGQIGSAAIYGQMEKNKMGKDFGGAEKASVQPKGLASVLPETPGAGRIGRSEAPIALPDLGIKEPGPGNIMRSLPNPLSITDLQSLFDRNIFETADEYMPSMGNKIPRRLEQGGMVTGGKFDHKTNPIDIVKKGQKIGEMTGGEVILNPAQQQKLSKESAYFRQLLKKFNKQK
jgi:hypothetical protein